MFFYQDIHKSLHLNEHTLFIFMMSYAERKDRLCICLSITKFYIYINLFMADAISFRCLQLNSPVVSSFLLQIRLSLGHALLFSYF